MSDLLSMFESLENNSKEPTKKDVVLRAPFAYPGGKSRSIKHIVPKLPYSDVYVEPFGGSAAVLLARSSSKLEVFNDRYAGVVAFYRCVRDPVKFAALCDRLDLTVHSREEFVHCKDTWITESDDVERAAKWYYMSMYSFGSIGRNWGRSTSARGQMAGKIRNKLAEFPAVHERFRNVQVENQDWYDCVMDYDSPDTIFYLDPPYVDANRGTYKDEMTVDDHRKLIDTVFSLKGFVAVSGYPNPLYDNQPWDSKHKWDVFISIKSAAYTEGNNKANLEGIEERGYNTECLWIKEAK
jgi:DNA adenine methylase